MTEAAKAVGVTRKTLYSHIDKGFISVTRKQGKRYIHVAELERHYGSVSLPALQGNKPIQQQSKQNGSEQIEALTALVQELQQETRQLRADVLESQKVAQEALQALSEGILRIEDKRAEKEASTTNKSWWRKLWD